MTTVKSLETFALHTIDGELHALKDIRSRLVSAIDNVDGRDAATLIKLGSDVSRVIAALDWNAMHLKRKRNTIRRISEEITTGKTNEKGTTV